LGECILCYSCDSEEDVNCIDLKNKTAISSINCTYEGIPTFHKEILQIDNLKDSSFLSFSCIKYEITDDSNKIVTRGCTLARTSTYDPCTYYNKTLQVSSRITKISKNLSTCSVCTRDACNGVQKPIFNSDGYSDSRYLCTSKAADQSFNFSYISILLFSSMALVFSS
ncbi:hypothetical protein C0J52_20297, partial [Blattella germanica]